MGYANDGYTIKFNSSAIELFEKTLPISYYVRFHGTLLYWSHCTELDTFLFATSFFHTRRREKKNGSLNRADGIYEHRLKILSIWIRWRRWPASGFRWQIRFHIGWESFYLFLNECARQPPLESTALEHQKKKNVCELCASAALGTAKGCTEMFCCFFADEFDSIFGWLFLDVYPLHRM